LIRWSVKIYVSEEELLSRAIYPGSFDPVTFGHLDVISRSAAMFDEVIVGILSNNAKHPLFTVEERKEMLKETIAGFSNVSVITFDGLLIDYMKENNISVIVRGLRAITDFDYELKSGECFAKYTNIMANATPRLIPLR
jgi:pantetheine-phosphate adenylyltransferase